MALRTVLVCALATAIAGESIRVEYKLTKLDNPGGIIYNGKKCDMTGKCDPRLSGYVDTEKALNTWPGPKPLSQFTKIHEDDDVDSPSIQKIVSRDICVGSTYTKANLRVDAVDKDLTGTDQMDQFECMSVGSFRDVKQSEQSATWSTERPCANKFQPDKVKLMYQFRAYKIPERECGRPVGSSKKAGGGYGTLA
ncbi:hypothetical protein RvY_12765 [Ramazzottius varieornatus]|uniref:Uncharacterized protein n=1 Tax=Ramazzottius varieornatus TaxID=947166 RepID=A0A1D1VR13_RAMVA|nr:hypothetical protein RvY_12765 [Ramazzottius varieornatus]